jgi:SAM-dependent methyltransferase
VTRTSSLRGIEASSTLIRFAGVIASAQAGPVLDAPCGYGRNALALAAFGCTIIAVDRDHKRVQSLEHSIATWQQDNAGRGIGRILPMRGDLSPDAWCFRPLSFGAIVCVHYDFRPILPDLISAIRPGGYLYIETFDGQGRNYVELPKAGELRERLTSVFVLKFYRERKVGPARTDSVSIKALAQKL